MQSDARTRLAAAQLELTRALVANEVAPPAFDSSRVQATADALLRKRSQSVARAWPRLTQSLGAAFGERFTRYARSRPSLPEGGAPADGREFARAMARAGSLADDAAVEVLAFDLRYRVRADGVIARSGVSFRAALLSQSRRFVVAIRLPLCGERWINVPLKIL